MATNKEKQMFSRLILRLLWKMKANGWESSRAASMLWNMWGNTPITILQNQDGIVGVSPAIPFVVVDVE
jgi:hypothetical protein